MGSPKRVEELLLAKGVPANVAAMRKAAEVFEIKVGKGKAADKELLGLIRIHLAEALKDLAEDERLYCSNCGEVSNDATDFCPYCGHEGDGPADAALGIAASGSAPAQSVEVQIEQMGVELEERMTRITELSGSFVSCSYDLGVEVKAIHDKQLYKAQGYETFTKFCEEKLPFARSSAYRMISIVEKFSREDFLKVGHRKLGTLALVEDTEQREELTEKARGGASARQIERDVDTARGRSERATTTPSPEPVRASVVPPPEREKVTLLSRVTEKALTMALRSASTGKVLRAAGVLQGAVPDAYAELQLSDDVFLRIGLHLDEKSKLVGLVAKFERSEQTGEADPDDATE